MRALGLAIGLIACAPLVAFAQAAPAPRVDMPPVVNPDRNLEAARSYSPSPALEAIGRSRPAPTPAPVGSVNGSASRDWALHTLG